MRKARQDQCSRSGCRETVCDARRSQQSVLPICSIGRPIDPDYLNLQAQYAPNYQALEHTTTQPKFEKFLFRCCFCNTELQDEDTYSVVLVWPNDDEQTWWSHRNCFVTSLHPVYRIMRDDDD